ncbi:MAG: hypothetical protein HKO53_09980 [Gemmatimonadetes bacterium]|nr:hypothetical protein [Gemmatimonadota bacterium]
MRLFASILMLGLLVLLVVTLGSPPPHLSVVNRSGQPVRAVEASVGSVSFHLDAVGVADSVEVPIPLRGAGPLRVRVEFEDGRTGEIQAGYFAPGMRGPARIDIVAPDSVSFRSP